MSTYKRNINEVADGIVNDITIMLECNSPNENINKKIKTILDTSKPDILKLKNHFNESNAKLLEGINSLSTNKMSKS
jgi:hypothetical protein